jgi:hypothetical protein
MKIFTLLTISLLFCFSSYSQNIKHIAMFEGETYNNTGIYGATSTTVYRYSYYFQEWFPLEMTGLPNINGNINILDLAVADTGTSYTSGIYIIADTAVYNYNWYSEEWYALSNAGLIRKNDTVQLSGISAFGKGSSTDHSIFCISDTSVFEYEWYYPQWFPLANTGLSVKIKPSVIANNNIKIYPNPFKEKTTVELILDKSYSGKVSVVIYCSDGKILFTDIFEVLNKRTIVYKLNEKFSSGIYYYEIKTGNTKAISTLIVD